MSLQLDDTIAAIAAPAGVGLRSIIRVSGPQSLPLVSAMLTSPLQSQIRGAWHQPVKIALPGTDIPLTGSALCWPTARSFTGQPTVELHLPASLPLLNDVLRQLYAQGARPAEPGEFTLRAFLSGRVDLLQAEAVLGVIDASQPEELRTALSQLAGGISHPIADIHETLLLQLADLEAGLDFAEEDIDFVSREECAARWQAAIAVLDGLLHDAQRRMSTTGLPRVVLAGLPNAGKSTLFNSLSAAGRALVSPIPGTTRDYLTVVIDDGSFRWELVDTAGVEAARDEIEQAAADLRETQFTRANLILWCSDASASREQQTEDDAAFDRAAHEYSHVLRLFTKADLHAAPFPSLTISASTGQGLAEFKQQLRDRLSTDFAPSEIIASTAARCSDSLQQARDGLQHCQQQLAMGSGDELLAFELRHVIDHLGRIVGRIHTDDILDRIFSRFCIGK